MGHFIAALRKANGLTQKQLADKLNLSDKTVSRWERDETAPDISLIPVIADIFGVTCDELLCGERKINNEASSGDDEVLSAKGEKQRRRLLSVAFYQHRSRSLISIGIAIVGIIAAAICNFAFYRARLGFLISVIFFLAAGICQAIFTNRAYLSVATDEFSDNETNNFNRQVMLIHEFVCCFVLSLAAFALPLIYATWDAYIGLDLSGWLINGFVCALVTAIISYMICVVVNAKLTKKHAWEITDKEKIRHYNVFLFVKCAVCFAIIAGITVLIWCAVTDGGYAPKFATGTIFNDYESFAEFVEKDVPDTDTYYVDSEDNEYTYAENIIDELGGSDDEEYYDPYEGLFFDDDSYGLGHNGERVVIKNENGDILLDCKQNNFSIVLIECGDESNGWLPIRVVTKDDLPEAKQKLMMIGYATLGIIALEAGASIFIYLKKREKIGK